MAAGQIGFMDFVGYRVGVPSGAVAATCGFRGVMDWTGLPCGVPSSGPQPSTVGGTGRKRRVIDDPRIGVNQFIAAVFG